jgi:hypothetical protein
MGGAAGGVHTSAQLVTVFMSGTMDFITAWIHMTPCYGKPKGYKFARDKTNIKGNQLVTEFAQTVDTCGIDTATAKPTGTLQVGMTFGFAATCAAQRACVCSKT